MPPIGVNYRSSWETWPQKLNAADAEHIRSLLTDGYSQSEIADAFNVHQSTISDIKAGLRFPEDDVTQRPYYGGPGIRTGLPPGYWRGRQHPWLRWNRAQNREKTPA